MNVEPFKCSYLWRHCGSTEVKILDHEDVDLDFWKKNTETYFSIDGAPSLDTKKAYFPAFPPSVGKENQLCKKVPVITLRGAFN